VIDRYCPCRTPAPVYRVVDVREIRGVELHVQAPTPYCEACGKAIPSDELRAIASLSKRLSAIERQVAEHQAARAEDELVDVAEMARRTGRSRDWL
jgi:hypothetical protein